MRNRDSLSEFDVETEDFFEDPAGQKDEKEPKEEMVPKSRLDDLIAQRDSYANQRDEAIRSMLSTRQQSYSPPPQPQVPEVQLPQGVDEEAAALLKPILDPVIQQTIQVTKDIATQEALAAVNNTYGPALQEAQRQAGIREIDGRVEGFSSTLMQDVKQMFNELPPEERQRYDNPVGIEALALKAKLNRVASGGGDFSDMAHSVPRGTSEHAPKGSEEDVWKMSDEEFERRYG